MSKRLSLSLFILLFVFSSFAAAQENPRVEVLITGLDPVLQNNVLVGLTVNRHRMDRRITDFQLRRIFRKVEGEVKAALEPFGYYDPQVTIVQEKIDDVWLVDIRVKKGEPVTVSSVSIEIAGEGKEHASLVDGIRTFPLRPGDVLDHQLYEKGKRVLASRAIVAGYRDAVFTRHLVSVDQDKKSAVIELFLDTGPLYRFGETTFDTDFLSHSLLARMLPYDKGDPYSPRQIVQLRQSLYNADYFASVDVIAGEPDQQEREIPVYVMLKPGLRNKYGLGVGYGTDTGARGTLEWTNRRLNRFGHQLTVSLQPSERKSYSGVVYTIPIKNPKRERLSFISKWEKESFENTNTELRSVSIGYDNIRPAGEYSVYVRHLDEDYDTGWESGSAVLLMPGLRSTVRYADDRLVTKQGVRVTLDLTGAAQNVVSDSTFVQATVSSKAIYSFSDRLRILGRFSFGGTMINSIYDLPPSLRYYAGGDQSVRGYAYKSISPEDQFGNVLGGRYLMTYSLEIERKLYESWSAAVFVDSGDVFNAVEDLAMKHGIGLGFRWNAPFGQVRFDFARGLSEGGSWRIHFNVGADL